MAAACALTAACNRLLASCLLAFACLLPASCLLPADEPFTRKDIIHLQVGTFLACAAHLCNAISHYTAQPNTATALCSRGGGTALRTVLPVPDSSLYLPLGPLQDPLNLSGRNLAEFDHVKKDLVADEEARAAEEVRAAPCLLCSVLLCCV